MKFSVTPQLALTLKTLRAQNALASKAVADAVGRSPSYLSKLENGEVKTIEKDLLTQLLQALYPHEDFYGHILPSVSRLLFALPEDCAFTAAEQPWFIHYDVIDRPVFLEKALLDDISRLMAEAQVTPEELVALVNQNIDTEMSESFPANQLIPLTRGGAKTLMFRLELNASDLRKALGQSVETMPYYQVTALLFALYRRVNFPEATKKLPPDEAITVLRCLAAFLDKWNIHTLTGYTHHMASDEYAAEQVTAIAQSRNITTSIASLLSEIEATDTVMTVKRLSDFYRLLTWDPAFALKLMSLPFPELEPLSFQKKKELLDKIEALIEEYAELPDIERLMERY